MTFLPIVQRELRAAARRKSTFAIRAVTAMLGGVLSGFLFFFIALAQRAGHAPGGMVFMVLSGYMLLIALLAGVLLAADSLSEERREGTLGFLFLTDLKGYDIVLGKFAGVSLNAFYGLLAVFPILAVCLVAGGVSGAEFWRMCLALINTLFFSVASALWMSALCRSSYRALAASVCLLVCLLAVTGVASALSSLAPVLFYLGAFSPLASFRLASDAGYLYQAGKFWTALGACHLLGWVFLGLAGWRLRFFREAGENGGLWRRLLTRNMLAGRADRRAELLAINPVLWLLDDSRRLRWVTWALAVVGGSALILTSARAPFALFFNTYLAWPCYFLLKVFFAIQTCRFFTEARRTGALELLCCTPLTLRAMVAGQWMALRRVFLWPVITLMLAQLGCLCFLGSTVFSMPAGAGFMGYYEPLMILKQIANSGADFFAVGWFGMWLALTLQRPGMATGLTILYVLILPTLAFCVPTLASDAVFIVVGWSKLWEKVGRGNAGWAAGGPLGGQGARSI